ncbi:hypothetical protein RHOSPDRAFT_31236 [Rhodotorula sp. JG-1b]|nr:hypothetical protein RHOSPDRAFT_31236 [Rhodotorula sp. JG-1b]
MAEVFSDLLQAALRDRDPNANPWSLLRGALTARVRRVARYHVIAQLYALSAIIAVVTVLLAACMLVKYRQGRFWLMRTHRATGGTYLVVHYSNGWTTLFLLFLGVLQGYICFYAQAWFVNSAAILIPSLAAIAVAILAWQAHIRYWGYLKAYKSIDAVLANVASQYNGTFDLSLLSSGSSRQLIAEFTSKLSRFETFFRWVFVTYLISSIILEVVLCLTASLHLRELRKTMHELRGRAYLSEEARAQETVIKHGYQSLSYVTWSIIAACTAINALFLFVVAAGPKVIYIERYSAVASLLPLWLFSVLGLPLSALYLHRLLTQDAPQEPQGADAAIELPGRNTSRPPSISGKDGQPHEAYPMEKLSSLHYGTSPNAATMSLDSDIAGSLDTASPLVRNTPPPGFQQAFYSSYSSRPV